MHANIKRACGKLKNTVEAKLFGNNYSLNEPVFCFFFVKCFAKYITSLPIINTLKQGILAASRLLGWLLGLLLCLIGCLVGLSVELFCWSVGL